MSIYSLHPITLGAVHTYPLASRKSKVSVRDFRKPPAANASLTKVLDSLPNILAAEDLRRLLGAIHMARKQRKAILWGIGGHIIKVGLGPVLIDLMKRGFVSGIAMNGAALIHDFEIALAGNTSEDVEAGIGEGRFGMAAETGQYINAFESATAKRRGNSSPAASSKLSMRIPAFWWPRTSTASRSRFIWPSARTYRTCIPPPTAPPLVPPRITTSDCSARLCSGCIPAASISIGAPPSFCQKFFSKPFPSFAIWASRSAPLPPQTSTLSSITVRCRM